MSLINIQNLTFSYDEGDKIIFDNVSFQIDTDWKLGLVGRNGRGKTTFLNLLLKKLEYQGNISTSINFTYFPFEVTDKNKLVIQILTELSPTAEEWEIIREISYLEVDVDVLYRKFSDLSNGEQTKILLAGLFLKNDNFLLIDEPTNHLDSTGRKILAKYLRRKKSFILVSHDRYFLDMCIDHVLSINKSNIEVQKGNFSAWFENFNQKQKSEFNQNEQLKKEIERLTKATKQATEWASKIEKSKYGNGPVDRGYIGHKSAKMMKHAKATENRGLKAIEEKKSLLQNTERLDSLKIFPLTFHKDILMKLENVQIQYNDKVICNPINLTVSQGDRILLQGKNGCGKSSLLKLIMGDAIDHKGQINVSKDLIISYIPQTTDSICGTLTDFAKNNNIDEALFRNVLNKIGFDQKDNCCNLSQLSAGQKKKIFIAKSLCEKAHLYIWDEPLNYLDIFTRMQIEELLDTFKPTMILIEHDLTFGEKIATSKYQF